MTALYVQGPILIWSLWVEAARPDFKAARPDFEAAWPDSEASCEAMLAFPPRISGPMLTILNLCEAMLALWPANQIPPYPPLPALSGIYFQRDLFLVAPTFRIMSVLLCSMLNLCLRLSATCMHCLLLN